jgi:hypothetical protein
VEAETSEVADRSSFVEHVEVAESELLRDRLLNFEDSGVLTLLGAVVLTELYRPRTDLTLDCESDRVRGSGDLDCLTQSEELLANLGVLVRVDGDHRLVLGLRDSQMLAVNGDEVKVELSLALILSVLENDLEVSGLLVCLEGDSIRVV